MNPNRTPDFTLKFTDPALNALIRNTKENQGIFSRHFNSAEDFFIRLDRAVTFPSWDIHHHVGTSAPSPEYLTQLTELIKSLLPQIGPLLAETSWYFDPRDIFHPGFYQLYDIKGRKYLFVLKMELGLQPRGCEIIKPGTNDRTPIYRTRDIYLDAEILPLEKEQSTSREFWIHRYFSETWSGEQGRGYFVQGVWIDDSLSKFLSKVFISEGKKIYPFYPFKCRYGTVSSTVVDFSPEGRHRSIKLLDRAIEDLSPYLDQVQKIVQTEGFSEKQELFTTLRKKFEPRWESIWKNLRIDSYLNHDEQKEFTYHE